jgi:uncharacterized membrane protein YidH (DUF202 family)
LYPEYYRVPSLNFSLLGGSLGFNQPSERKACDLTDEKNEPYSIIVNEAQLVLAEKRTSLAVMRTGIAVLALPLSVMSFLIATSKYYIVDNVLHFLVPLGILSLALIVFGFHLIIRSILHMRRYDHLIHEIKVKHSVLGEFID